MASATDEVHANSSAPTHRNDPIVILIRHRSCCHKGRDYEEHEDGTHIREGASLMWEREGMRACWFVVRGASMDVSDEEKGGG